jgi:predicted nucleotidyltransferase component of viral defense system
MKENPELPISVKSLELRLRSATDSAEGWTHRRRVMAAVILAQMLPPAAIKGGTAMKIRLGEKTTRFSQDLDIARQESLRNFLDQLEENLKNGWHGFTGTVTESRSKPKPTGVPADYIMTPYEIKMQYLGRPWTTVVLEVGHDELGDTFDAHTTMSEEVTDLFESVGLPAPTPVPVVATHHQIAQKIHATSRSGSERAHDLVDLQLLEASENLDLPLIKDICTRLFDFRRGHQWPPTVIENEGWDSLYKEAADGIPVLQSVGEAVAWSNDFILRIVNS